jgi:hypothetical protein
VARRHPVLHHICETESFLCRWRSNGRSQSINGRSQSIKERKSIFRKIEKKCIENGQDFKCSTNGCLYATNATILSPGISCSLRVLVISSSTSLKRSGASGLKALTAIVTRGVRCFVLVGDRHRSSARISDGFPSRDHRSPLRRGRHPEEVAAQPGVSGGGPRDESQRNSISSPPRISGIQPLQEGWKCPRIQ